MSPLHASSTYQSYLVRLWRPSEEVCWRATVRHVLTGEEWHFEDLERLFLFLHERTGGKERGDS
ncbi:MAG: hypothetical protein HUU38_08440 [Anaerolineales bacterium]|nr:hypothetical protein [Anaerolineales bacterium]